MKKSQSNGFTLVEALLSVLIGVILLSGMWSVFMDMIRTFNLHNEQAFLQSGGRYITNLLSRDIRMSGYTGCSPNTVIRNVLKEREDNKLWMTKLGRKLVGYSSSNNGAQLIDSNAISAAVVVNRVLMETGYSVEEHDSGTGSITLSLPHKFNSGDLLAMIDRDCEQVSYFKAGDGTVGNTISYTVSGGSNLYNCSRIIKGKAECSGSELNEPIENKGLMLFPVEMTAYYIREYSGVPTLYRKKAGLSVSGSSLSAEALVEGVEDLHFLYGYDDNGDGLVDQYLSSQLIEADGKSWGSVVSIKMEIVMRSMKEVLLSPKSYMLSGKTYSTSDLYLRKVMTKFVSLRNK